MMIKVATLTGRIRVNAIVFGQWAAHKSIELAAPPWMWSVTHAPSGRAPISAYFVSLTRSQAIRVAHRIAQFIGDLEVDGNTPRSDDLKDLACQIQAIYGEAMAEGDEV